MHDLYVIAPLSSLSKRTRLFKLANSVFKKKYFSKIYHVGWERIPGESKESELEGFSVEKEIILNGGGYGQKSTRLKYIIWMFKVFLYSIRMPKRSTVWALGLESALPVTLASLFKGHKVYFDDADRFLLLFKWPSFLFKIIRFFEIYTSKRVFLHIVPNIARYDYFSDKFFELKNLPSLYSLRNSNSFISRLPDLTSYKIVINVNGWLGSNRGMDVVLSVLNHFSGRGIAILLSGKLDCESARKISILEHCFYLGELNNEQALSTYYISDFVFTYYDPSFPINKYAESNKWGDAMYTNTGILVNNEVLTAEFLFRSGVFDELRYFDNKTLIDFIENCLVDPSIIEMQKKAVSALKAKFNDFDSVINFLFESEHA